MREYFSLYRSICRLYESIFRYTRVFTSYSRVNHRHPGVNTFLLLWSAKKSPPFGDDFKLDHFSQHRWLIASGLAALTAVRFARCDF